MSRMARWGLLPVLALVTSWILPPDRAALASWPIPIDLPAELLEADVALVKTGELEGTLGPRRSRYTAADVHTALRTASPRTACIVRHEVGGWGYDPYAVGSQGERGPAQLSPRGLLPDFYRRGYTDPFNPYQAIAYLEWALAAGLARNWSPVLLGRC